MNCKVKDVSREEAKKILRQVGIRTLEEALKRLLGCMLSLVEKGVQRTEGGGRTKYRRPREYHVSITTKQTVPRGG